MRASALAACAALACGGSPPTGPLDAPVGLSVDAGPDIEVAVGAEVVLSATVSGGEAAWDAGDGTVLPGAEVRHTYDTPGNRVATVTVTGPGGAVQAASIAVTAYLPSADPPPVAASRMALDEAHGRLFVPVPEADHVAVVDLTDGSLHATVPTCRGPSWIAVQDGIVAVSCPDDAEIARFDASTLTALPSLALAAGARPAGIVGRGGAWWFGEPATGRLGRLEDDLTYEDGCADAHAIALDAREQVLAPRFRAASHGGQASQHLGVHRPAEPGCAQIPLALDPGPDSDTAHRGVMNLVDALAISPDGGLAYVGGLTANVLRGLHRDGQPLTPESTVRASLRVVDLSGGVELADRRKAFDNHDRVSAIALSPRGNWLWVAHPGTRALQRLDAWTLAIRGGIPNAGVGLNALAVSADGSTLYAHAWLDRTVRAYRIAPVEQPALLWEAPTVTSEPLDPVILRGKVLFQDTADTRLARHGYLSCATCHPDGDHDGLTWDFTDRGEGLRNTIPLLGRGGLDMGRLHWTGNFDEIQDFEADIRHGQGGTGLLDDADWSDPDVAQPLGAPKAGRSADLDALAAYVHSLTALPPSPWPPAPEGEAVFLALGCDTCHDPARHYTDSALGPGSPLHDVGTLTEASGARLGQPLVGLDTPTLLGVHATAPYLHDGSADTLADAILAHVAALERPLDPGELASLVAWLRAL